MVALNLDDLEATAKAATPGPWHQGAHYIGAGGEPYDPEVFVGQASILCDAEHIAAFDPPTVRALITRIREAERERDEARWAAGIVGDVARESSGGWQDAAAELHATQARLREAEAVIEKVKVMLPGPRTFAESLSRDFSGNLWPRTINADEMATIFATYKPTNQEGGNDGT